MKIGLVRHFEVLHSYKYFQLMSSDEFARWCRQYDQSAVKEKPVPFRGIAWDACFSSDMPRAIATANSIFAGEIIKTESLREIAVAPIQNTNRRLPFLFWMVMGRLAWLVSHKSQQESRAQSLQRIRGIVDRIIATGNRNVLIVSHGASMHLLRKELTRRGFSGDKFTKPLNGVLYVLQKSGKEHAP